jgi:hypothetical protein
MEDSRFSRMYKENWTCNARCQDRIESQLMYQLQHSFHSAPWLGRHHDLTAGAFGDIISSNVTAEHRSRALMSKQRPAPPEKSGLFSTWPLLPHSFGLQFPSFLKEPAPNAHA